MENTTELKAAVMLSGTFECRDKDGVLLKTIDFKLPLSELKPEEKEDHGDQRSE